MVTFIANNPGVAATVGATLVSIIVGLVAAYWKIVAGRLDKLEQTDAKLVGEIGALTTRVERYEEHVGAGDKILEKLMTRVERHMTEEEDQVWNGITELSNKLTTIHQDNLLAHSAIVERLAKVEAKMPNGELTRLVGMVQSLLDK